MSRTDEMVRELCPNGVEFKPLGDLVRIRNGRDYKMLAIGDVPVFGSGGIIASVSDALHPGPSVLIPRKGSLGNIFHVDRPFWVVDTIFYTEIGDELESKYLYYWLLGHLVGIRV